MSPEKTEGAPPPAERLPEITSTATAKRQGTHAGASVAREAGNRPSRRKGRPPLAPASVFSPVGRRKSWWYTYKCQTCGSHLFGRARDLGAVTGERRAPCGHRVQVVAARIYTQPSPGATP
jgi:hypothetical protein